jgi:hypothetical protein
MRGHPQKLGKRNAEERERKSRSCLLSLSLYLSLSLSLFCILFAPLVSLWRKQVGGEPTSAFLVPYLPLSLSLSLSLSLTHIHTNTHTQTHTRTRTLSFSEFVLTQSIVSLSLDSSSLLSLYLPFSMFRSLSTAYLFSLVRRDTSKQNTEQRVSLCVSLTLFSSASAPGMPHAPLCAQDTTTAVINAKR